MTRRKYYVGKVAKVAKAAEDWLGNQRHQGNRSLNAFISQSVNDTVYVEKLRDSFDRSCSNNFGSSIDGKLIVIKDNICTVSEPTTCASTILKGFRSPFAATVVSDLGIGGCLLTGKTNLDEFGMGSHSTNSAFGPTRNCISIDGQFLSAGGSSGGSAVAVATNQSHAALGTDTGGSVRLPAAYTGIVGFKPSYGSLSRWGVVAYANSLDTVGIFVKKASVASYLYASICQRDTKDPTCLSEQSQARIRDRIGEHNHEHSLQYSIPCFRFGVPKEYNTAELEPAVRKVWLKALQKLQSLGHTIHPVSLPTTEVALSAYYVIAAAEASSNLAKYDGVRYGNRNRHEDLFHVLYAGTRARGFGREVRRRILLGSYSLSAGAIDNYFIKAQKVRRLVQNDFNNVFRLGHPLLPPRKRSSETDARVDFLITPTSQSLPPTLEAVASRNPVDTFADDVLTVPASLAGLPAVTIPVPIGTRSTPSPLKPSTVGIQIIGQYGRDPKLLSVGQTLQQAFAGGAPLPKKRLKASSRRRGTETSRHLSSIPLVLPA